jgi:prepilin-type N-terminal cleavage/methylation domain-containing protein
MKRRSEFPAGAAGKGEAKEARRRPRAGACEGFTLLEALVAMAILAVVLASFLGLRTTALVDATQARNYRLARELAERVLSELRAGARETPPESGVLTDFEKYPGFSYKILIGTDDITDHEANEATEASYDGDYDRTERLSWQRDRDDLRLARQKGLDVTSLREQRDDAEEKRKEEPPADTDFEDIAVVIYFPNAQIDDPDAPSLATHMLKARVSTLAISGLTPEQAQEVAKSRGQEPAAGSPESGPLTGGDR